MKMVSKCDDLSAISTMLEKASVVQVNELSFAGRKMKLDTAADAQEIVDAIKNFKDLQALRLEGNTLGLEAAIVIAKALEGKKEFERALWSDMYTGRLRSEIPPSLEHLGNGIIIAKAHLKELDLSDNAFGPDGVKGIQKLLTSEASYTLHTLRLNNNGLGIGGGKILSQAFTECYNSSRSTSHPFALKVFISGRNRLENEGAKALSNAFKLLGSLEEIVMPQNGIRPEGISCLASAFKENKNLRVVNVNDNTFTESGAKALAECIPHLQKLETLNIGDCLLKDKGANILASALAVEMPCLKEVIMSFNEIRQGGAVAVAKAMKNKDKLQMLDLDGNHLGDSTNEVEEIMSSFNRLDALTSFDNNEEPDSDEDESEGEEEEKEETKPDNGEADELSLQIKGIGLTKDSPLLNSVAKTNGEPTEASFVADIRSFLQNPSLDGWVGLPKDERRRNLEFVVKEDLLPFSDKIAFAFVQSCEMLSRNLEAVTEVADCILATAFVDTRCVKEDLVASLLVYMGLLKAETKVEKAKNLKGPLHGLASFIKSVNFPANLTQYFIAFLMKPNPLLDRFPDERHVVMQALYNK